MGRHMIMTHNTPLRMHAARHGTNNIDILQAMQKLYTKADYFPARALALKVGNVRYTCALQHT